jgi:hypothetical protein
MDYNESCWESDKSLPCAQQKYGLMGERAEWVFLNGATLIW